MAYSAGSLRNKALVLALYTSGLRNSTLRAVLYKDVKHELEKQDVVKFPVYPIRKRHIVQARQLAMFFAKKLCSRINKKIAASADPSSNILSLGKKSPTAQDIANIIRATLTKIESEGLSEQVVRKTIQNKIEKYMANPKHH